jgi:hypothetical protein
MEPKAKVNSRLTSSGQVLTSTRMEPAMRILKTSLSLVVAATVLGPLFALSAYAATILAAAAVAP